MIYEIKKFKAKIKNKVRNIIFKRNIIFTIFKNLFFIVACEKTLRENLER